MQHVSAKQIFAPVVKVKQINMLFITKVSQWTSQIMSLQRSN